MVSISSPTDTPRRKPPSGLPLTLGRLLVHLRYEERYRRLAMEKNKDNPSAIAQIETAHNHLNDFLVKVPEIADLAKLMKCGNGIPTLDQVASAKEAWDRIVTKEKQASAEPNESKGKLSGNAGALELLGLIPAGAVNEVALAEAVSILRLFEKHDLHDPKVLQSFFQSANNQDRDCFWEDLAQDLTPSESVTRYQKYIERLETELQPAPQSATTTITESAIVPTLEAVTKTVEKTPAESPEEEASAPVEGQRTAQARPAKTKAVDQTHDGRPSFTEPAPAVGRAGADPNPEMTTPDSPGRWAKLFGFSANTLKRRFKDGAIRHKKLSSKSYQIAIDDLPAIHQSKFRNGKNPPAK